MTKEEYRTRFPETFFIKTRLTLDNPTMDEIRENFIPDEDQPEFPEITERTRLCLLSLTSYPGVLGRNTALEAGLWAMSKCENQHWDVTTANIRACLANLEMDF